jgi:hypothetical protein
MEYLSKLEDLAGKTIMSTTETASRVLVKLTDGTALVLGVDEGYGLYIETKPSLRLQLKAGIISQEEYKDHKKRAYEACRQNTKERELKELARLKEKYEGK